MTDRERLLKILNVPIYPHENVDLLEAVADYLLDNGVKVPVLCKDCKHYHTHNRSAKFDCKELYCCRSALKKVGPEDFCSLGERKDNATD